MTAKLTPYIKSEDARAQMEFYKNALGGEIQSVMTYGQVPGMPEEIKDKVMHSQMEVAGNELFFSDAEPDERQYGKGISLGLGYHTQDEARDAFNKLSDNGKINHPFEQQPWGLFYGEVQDKYGITWMITSEV